MKIMTGKELKEHFKEFENDPYISIQKFEDIQDDKKYLIFKSSEYSLRFVEEDLTKDDELLGWFACVVQVGRKKYGIGTEGVDTQDPADILGVSYVIYSRVDITPVFDEHGFVKGVMKVDLGKPINDLEFGISMEDFERYKVEL